jgi:hypothetical protein
LDQVIVCCSGGGLAAGCITVLKERFPEIDFVTPSPPASTIWRDHWLPVNRRQISRGTARSATPFWHLLQVLSLSRFFTPKERAASAPRTRTLYGRCSSLQPVSKWSWSPVGCCPRRLAVRRDRCQGQIDARSRHGWKPEPRYIFTRNVVDAKKPRIKRIETISAVRTETPTG